MDEYLTLKGQGFCEIVERRSKFLGFCRGVSDKNEAESFIAQKKSEHKDAAHNVWAYIIDSGNMRASDDGEPSGTAGTPVLEVLKKEGLVKAAVVVTRYFGGVLLGAGGLVRAYSSAAKSAVDNAGISVMRLCGVYRLICPYKDGGKTENALLRLGAYITKKDFSQNIGFEFYIQPHSETALLEKIAEITQGSFSPEKTGTAYYPF